MALKHSREICHSYRDDWWSSWVQFMWSFNFLISFFFFFNFLRACGNVHKITLDCNVSRSIWSICLNFKCYICICTAVSDIKSWCTFWIPTNYTFFLFPAAFPFILLLSAVSSLHTRSNTDFNCKIQAT